LTGAAEGSTLAKLSDSQLGEVVTAFTGAQFSQKQEYDFRPLNAGYPLRLDGLLLVCGYVGVGFLFHARSAFFAVGDSP